MEPLGATIRVNRALALAVLMLTIGVFINSQLNDNHRPPSSVSAYHFYPYAKFYLTFQNRVSPLQDNVIRLDCQKDLSTGSGGETRLLGPIWIHPNQDAGWSFRTAFDQMDYICFYHCMGHQGSFMAFQDTPSFEDDMCGGRHCTWKFITNGLYLFNLKDQMYHLKVSFLPPVVNNGTRNGTSRGQGGKPLVSIPNFDNSTGHKVQG